MTGYLLEGTNNNRIADDAGASFRYGTEKASSTLPVVPAPKVYPEPAYWIVFADSLTS